MRLRLDKTAPLDRAMSDLVLRPWFDKVALHAIVHWYFPLSRAWAAAIASEGNLDAFLAEIGIHSRVPRQQVQHTLDFVVRRHAAYQDVAAAWRETLFAPKEPATAALREAERRRISRAQAAMTARSAFVPLHLMRRVPAVKWRMPTVAEVASRHASRLVEPEAAFPLPPEPVFDVSHAVPAQGARVQWLQFAATVGGVRDTAWARVVTPTAADPPTLIFLHGVAMETEFWREDPMMLSGLAEAGIRVIRPEGPWHGRRRPPGFYGGEPVIAQGPLGMLDLFAAWVAEVGALIRWARATSRGRVAVGGVSLGALTSQLLACAAAYWPPALLPDALLLVATSGAVIDAAAGGRLGRALGVPARLAAHGWTAEEMTRWRPLVEPKTPPALAPDRIVMVLGEEDQVTPFRGGTTLARRWRVPSENVFIRPQGHFSVALGLARRNDPLRRLLEILQA
jgi:pimeloyl-ACP methyl ester carboxylesterase